MNSPRWHRTLLRLTFALIAMSGVADAKTGERDLYFSEALFYAHQGQYFEALERLDAELGQHYRLDEPSLDTLYPHINDAEFSVGDFELNYRMHHRAGRAISAVLEGDVEESVRNEAAYRLARIHFHKGQLVDAQRALERIEGRVPAEIRSDVEFLRANIFLSTAHPDEAAQILKRLQGAPELDGFSEYNLAIAYLQEDRQDSALQQLEKAGAVKAQNEPTLAIRDKANLVRGTLLLESGRFLDARASLEKVRLEGPFSNQALLSTGWADVSAERFEQALVPWDLLIERNRTDPAVQEAMLALPYAYGQLDLHGRAALLYGEALQSYSAEVDRLDESIDSIRRGKFLEALVREEIRKDKDWVIRLRSLPQAPETYYLMELLASHDFQTALQNYLDLEDLRGRLLRWQRGFDAYEDLIGARRAYYEPLLPELDQQFRELDSRRRVRLEQHKILADRMQGMLISPRPDFLATNEERALTVQLQNIRDRLGPDVDNTQALERIRRLEGLVTWSLETEYHERLTRFYEHLQSSQVAIDFLTRQYDAFVRVRQAATHSYVGYEAPIRRMRTRVGESVARIDVLMSRQGRMLEQVAVQELEIRVRRLESYKDRARYALANSYDRATNAQSEGSE